jgi:hypothetical protein
MHHTGTPSAMHHTGTPPAMHYTEPVRPSPRFWSWWHLRPDTRFFIYRFDPEKDRLEFPLPMFS